MDQEEIEQCQIVIDKLIAWSERMSHQTANDMIDVAGILQRVVENEVIKDDNARRANCDSCDNRGYCAG